MARSFRSRHALVVVAAATDGGRGLQRTVATRRHPSSTRRRRDATALARLGDRYLVVNAAWTHPPPDTISSVPVVP